MRHVPTKLSYEAPVTDVMAVKMERGLLAASGVQGSRDDYGDAWSENWE